VQMPPLQKESKVLLSPGEPVARTACAFTCSFKMGCQCRHFCRTRIISTTWCSPSISATGISLPTRTRCTEHASSTL
jgi:hypothetical protein